MAGLGLQAGLHPAHHGAEVLSGRFIDPRQRRTGELPDRRTRAGGNEAPLHEVGAFIPQEHAAIEDAPQPQQRGDGQKRAQQADLSTGRSGRGTIHGTPPRGSSDCLGEQFRAARAPHLQAMRRRVHDAGAASPTWALAGPCRGLCRHHSSTRPLTAHGVAGYTDNVIRRTLS